MANVTHVKRARVARPHEGIKVGDEYWVWNYKSGGRFAKRYFKHAPKPSETTNSEYLSSAYAIEETLDETIKGIRDGKTYDSPETIGDDIRSLAEEVRSLGSEQGDKLSNMPDGLQEGPSGQLLQDRNDACEALADAIDSIAGDIDAVEVGDDRDAWVEECVELIDGISWDWEQ